MASDHPLERPKPVRAVTTGMLPARGTVRPPPPSPSPPPTSSSAGPTVGSTEAKPPAKRARKAINCEPCRTSKLKCDRSRPCSSCVLRGTSSLCYQDSQANDSVEIPARGPPRSTPLRIDPAQELAKVRRSLTLLETYVLGSSSSPASFLEVAGGQLDYLDQAISSAPSVPAPHRAEEKASKTESPQPVDYSDKSDAPGSLGRQTGGLYAGPTSAATLLISNDPREGDQSSERHGSEDDPLEEYDRDLLALLPPLPTIDSLVAYYFDYCKWIYRYVNNTAFNAAWMKYKSGQSTDRLALATACVIIAVATYYLPEHHPLHDTIPPPEHDDEDPGERYYNLAMQVLDRHITEIRKYSLELVELHLVRCHYLMLAKKDGEGIWTIKGDLVTMATAMGLHRDPGKWKTSRDVAERRRWAWWNIVYLERSQAWLFGRPLAISSRHFDTQLPSYCDPRLDPTGRYYVAQFALFRLGHILGDIMDDAVSLRPVPYSSALAHDKALVQWMDALPPELQLDEFTLTRDISSSEEPVRRQAVQSIIVRGAYHHIRFSLHRPYASKAPTSRRTPEEEREISHSLELAISAAESLLTLVCQTHPSFLSNASLSVPGHMSWFAFHVFSAAMFFSFQLITHPDDPSAPRLREGVSRAMATLRATHGAVPVADKSYNILQALAPLYADDARAAPPAEREAQRQSVLARVRNLAFPYHDSPGRRVPTGSSGTASSPRVRTSDSPAAFPTGSIPPASPVMPGDMYGPHMQPPPPPPPPSSSSSMGMASDARYARGTPGPLSSMHIPLGPSLSHRPLGPLITPTGQETQQHHQQQQGGGYFGAPAPAYSGGHGYFAGPPSYPLTPGSSGIAQQLNPEAQMMWGAAIGFGPGEWLQFEDFAQRPGTAGGHPM